MKKICIFFLIVTLIIQSAACLSLSAEEAQGDKTPVLDIVKNQGDILPDDDIYNRELYYGNLNGCDFSNDIIFKIYGGMIFEWVYEDVDDIIQKSLSYWDIPWEWYVVYRERSLQIYKTSNDDYGKRIMLGDVYEEKPTFLSDIINSTIYSSKLHYPEEIYSKVVCFDAAIQLDGIVVYYVGNTQTIVRYYETHLSEPIDFTFEDYRMYTEKYREYLLSHPPYNEKGEFMWGGVAVSFRDFVENFEEYTKNDEINIPANDTEKDIDRTDKANNHSFIWYIIISTAVALFSATATVILVLRKKKRLIDLTNSSDLFE